MANLRIPDSAWPRHGLTSVAMYPNWLDPSPRGSSGFAEPQRRAPPPVHQSRPGASKDLFEQVLDERTLRNWSLYSSLDDDTVKPGSAAWMPPSRKPVLQSLVDLQISPRTADDCQAPQTASMKAASSPQRAPLVETQVQVGSQQTGPAAWVHRRGEPVARSRRPSLVDLDVGSGSEWSIPPTASTASQRSSCASRGGKWDFGWSPAQKRYYYYDRHSDEIYWTRPAGCMIELPRYPPQRSDLEMQGQQWEHQFRVEMLDAELENLRNEQSNMDKMLDELTTKITGRAQEGREDDRKQGGDLRHLMSGVKVENGYLWDVLEATPLTLATLQIEVQDLERRFGRPVSRLAPPMSGCGTPPRISGNPLT